MSATPKSLDGLVFILNVEVTIKESNVDAWLEAFKKARNAVLAESECLFFTLGRKLNIDPITQGPGDVPEGEVAISWSEGFKDGLEWFQGVQMKKDYYKPYMEVAIPLETSRGCASRLSEMPS